MSVPYPRRRRKGPEDQPISNTSRATMRGRVASALYCTLTSVHAFAIRPRKMARTGLLSSAHIWSTWRTSSKGSEGGGGS